MVEYKEDIFINSSNVFCSRHDISVGHQGHERMVVGFTTNLYLCNQCLSPQRCLSSKHADVKVYSIQHNHYVIEFVSDLRQVCGFLRVLLLHPPIKLSTMIYYWNIVEIGVKHNNPNPYLGRKFTNVSVI